MWKTGVCICTITLLITGVCKVDAQDKTNELWERYVIDSVVTVMLPGQVEQNESVEGDWHIRAWSSLYKFNHLFAQQMTVKGLEKEAYPHDLKSLQRAYKKYSGIFAKSVEGKIIEEETILVDSLYGYQLMMEDTANGFYVEHLLVLVNRRLYSFAVQSPDVDSIELYERLIGSIRFSKAVPLLQMEGKYRPPRFVELLEQFFALLIVVLFFVGIRRLNRKKSSSN